MIQPVFILEDLISVSVSSISKKPLAYQFKQTLQSKEFARSVSDTSSCCSSSWESILLSQICVATLCTQDNFLPSISVTELNSERWWTRRWWACAARRRRRSRLCACVTASTFVRACQCLRSSIDMRVCMYLCMCSGAPPTPPEASLSFTQLHYPWQVEYISVRLLHSERGPDKCI